MKISSYSLIKKHCKNTKIPLDIIFNISFQMYSGCFIMQSREKNTYLSLFYLEMINKLCKKSSISLKANVKFNIYSDFPN